MSTAAVVAALVVAALHVGFFVLESLLWTTPRGRKIFGQTVEGAEQTRVLAFNQGCYNGGLAVLLAWAALAERREPTAALLGFLVAMGVVGAASAKPTILVVQAVPAGIALAMIYLT